MMSATKLDIDEFDLVSRDKPVPRKSSCGKWNVMNSSSTKDKKEQLL